MGFGQLLVALASPIAKRVMIALGFGYVVFEGLQFAIEAYLVKVAADLAGLPPEVTAMLAILGFYESLGVIAGAFVGRLALEPLKRLVPDGSGGTDTPSDQT